MLSKGSLFCSCFWQKIFFCQKETIPKWVFRSIEHSGSPKRFCISPETSTPFRGIYKVGKDEVLLDDALQIAEHARAAQVPVELTVWEGLWHVFQQYASVLPEGQQSLENMGRFISS